MADFTELETWRQAHALTLAVYAATRNWPREEQFGLTSQIRRSVSSIGANISEGHGRFSNTEFHHFCNIARGSLSETRNHLLIARDLGYLSREQWQPLEEQAMVTARLLHALMRRLRGPSP